MIKTEGLTKIFRSGKREVIALNGIDLTIEKGEFVLIKGHSGCGKSTLLFCLGGMLIPSSGKVIFDGESLYEKNDKERAAFRVNKTGFVFQSYHLLPYLSVFENIMFAKRFKKDLVTEERAKAIAGSLNIEHRLDHKPAELSVGEKQRVALARTFITDPKVIFADEPTGNLDPENAGIVLGQLVDFKEKGGTVVMVTHGNEADGAADRVITMNKGRLI